MDVSLSKRLFIAVMPRALTRTKYIVKHKLFAEVGDNFFFQPRKIPINAEYIKFGNNVAVASAVTFICHDVMQKVFNNIDPSNPVKKKYGCIEVGDNVFIGSHSVILHDVKIGSNVIVAAGSVVVKDIPDGSVVGGVPAKVIGSFNELYRKRLEESKTLSTSYSTEVCWKRFYKDHDENKYEE